MEDMEALSDSILKAAKGSPAVMCRVLCGCAKNCGTEYGKKAFVIEGAEDAREVAEEVLAQTTMLSKVLGPIYQIAERELVAFRIEFEPIEGVEEKAKKIISNMFDDVGFARRADEYRKDN